MHCSGGIGRSGTFLTAFNHYAKFRDVLGGSERISERISVLIGNEVIDTHILGENTGNVTENEPSRHAVSLKETVHFMRLQRHPWMVEGMHQYILAYDIIIQLLKMILNGTSK